VFSFLDGFIPLTSVKQIEKQVRKITALTVKEAMTPDPVTIEPQTNIEAIAALMVDRNFHTLPVVAEGRIVGVVGKKDVLCTILKSQD
jgi:CBS domain-containing protein